MASSHAVLLRKTNAGLHLLEHERLQMEPVSQHRYQLISAHGAAVDVHRGGPRWLGKVRRHQLVQLRTIHQSGHVHMRQHG